MQLSAYTSDDDGEIEYISSSPSSPSHQCLAMLPPLPPASNEIEPDASQKARCKQHVVSTRPGEMVIGAYPFLIHVEEHTPWEFSSCHGSLLLHVHNCEDHSLNQDDLCRPCQALLSNDKFMKVLAWGQDGIQDHTCNTCHMCLPDVGSLEIEVGTERSL